MLDRRAILQSAIEIQASRPSADLSIEQYLMTPESMARQVTLLNRLFSHKRVLFLGDDDHMAPLLAKFSRVTPIVAEYDPRIRRSLRDFYAAWDIGAPNIYSYDARQPLPKDIKADAFYINPPYSSKNGGKGAKVWVSRVASAVPVGSTSVLVYPIDEKLSWTIDCTHEILEYAYTCGLMATNIDRDIHTYSYLPKDPGLLSSNIYLYKFKDIDPAEIKETEGEALYR